jgi:hypothetical protein
MTIRLRMAPDGRFAKSRNNACNVRMGGNGGDRFGADGRRRGPAMTVRPGIALGRAFRKTAQRRVQREDGR